MNWSVRALVIVQYYYCWSLSVEDNPQYFQFGGVTAEYSPKKQHQQKYQLV